MKHPTLIDRLRIPLLLGVLLAGAACGSDGNAEVRDPSTSTTSPTSFPGVTYDSGTEEFSAACDGPNRVYISSSRGSQGGVDIEVVPNDPQCLEPPR